MKFGLRLLSQGKPEWREKQIDYEGLKFLLISRRNEDGIQREKDFFKMCLRELRKVNVFFKERAADCFRKCAALESQVNPNVDGKTKTTTTAAGQSPTILNNAAEAMANRNETTGTTMTTTIRSIYRRVIDFGRTRRRGGRTKEPMLGGDDHLSVPRIPPEKERQLKEISEEFYYELDCLKRFQDDNLTGFRKILKKHDKLWTNTKGGDWFKREVLKRELATDKRIETMCQRVEQFRTQLERGDRKKAMQRLRVPTTDERRSMAIIFCSGFCSAIFLSAMFLVVLCTYRTKIYLDPPWIMVRLYRGYFLLFLNVTFIALCMYLWQQTGLNYVLILELNPRKHVTSESMFAMVAVCWALWAVSLLGYIAAPWIGAPRLCFPLIQTAIYIVLLLNPFNFAHRESRFWLLKRIFSCFVAPFRSGMFADFWTANQMSTLAPAFADAYSFVCLYTTGVRYSDGWIYFKVNGSTSTAANRTAPSTSAYNDFFYDPDGMNPNDGSGFCTSDAYGIRPAIILIPATIRFLQSLRRYYDSKRVFPHLYNACKYSTYYPRDIFGALYRWHSRRIGSPISPFYHLWMITIGINSIYSIFWDIQVDWKLWSKRPGKRLLREKRLYGCTWIYYLAAILDVIIRLRWATQISLRHAALRQAPNELVSTVLSAFDCFRRFVWNVFRLENEQLNNVEHLRVTRNTFAVPFKTLNDFGKSAKKSEDRKRKQIIDELKGKAEAAADSVDSTVMGD